MKIGELVKAHIPEIIRYCETTDSEELLRLEDPIYAKRELGINFPFFKKREHILEEESKRFWSPVHTILGQHYRISSQWFIGSTQPFIEYLQRLGIPLNMDFENQPFALSETSETGIKKRRSSASKSYISTRMTSRYKGNAIGNAQNFTIRNILSNLGDESFTQEDWQETKVFFNHSCAYCGTSGELLMEHAIPINRDALGEHHIGNLIPSCKACNEQKAAKHYDVFLEHDTERKEMIDLFMQEKGYRPLKHSRKAELVSFLLQKAHDEVGLIAAKYIDIINVILDETNSEEA
ncbi:MAG: HNH endonuclease [Campylobacteraceae bacterium]|nr:HNH endonuclease [Campylobacteraceae bacterium]